VAGERETVGLPGDAVAGGVGGVEALAGGDAGVLFGVVSEGSEAGRPEDAEGWGIPRGGGEGAIFEGEDERGGTSGVLGCVSGGLVGEGDGAAVPLPAGVPGAEMFVVPLLLDQRGAVGGEVDQDDAMDVGSDASAAGVEAFEIFGEGGDGENCRKGKSGDQALWEAHRGMLSEIDGSGEMHCGWER
jgi:hypothetical protein